MFVTILIPVYILASCKFSTIFSIEQVVDKLPSSKLYKILASSYNFISSTMTTMIRMKEEVIRHQYISTTNIRDDISTQYNIVICICYIYIYLMYIGVMIVLEGYRDGGIV